MNQLLKILIADDHELIISGLKQILLQSKYVSEIQSVTNGNEAIKEIESSNYDILISDVSMPEMDGIKLSSEIKNRFPHIKIIMLTQFSDMQIIKPLLKNNVDGILLKGGRSSEILEAIEKVISGNKAYSETIIQIIADCFSGNKQEEEILIKLSKREQQVLNLIAEEFTNKQIAEQLFISIPTVETYRSNLFRKFDVKNSVGLIRKAMHLGFIS